jgi:hypothetical protein
MTSNQRNNDLTRTCQYCGKQYQVKAKRTKDGLCKDCKSIDGLSQERHRLLSQIQRSKKEGVIVTLTFRQWMASLEHFDHACAYCQNPHMTVMDHFISIKCGGHTTDTNCVPSCRSCNILKERGGLPREWLERASSFLIEQCNGSAEEIATINEAVERMTSEKALEEYDRYNKLKKKSSILDILDRRNRKTVTDRVLASTSQVGNMLADKWGASKIEVYRFMIEEIAQRFDTPEQLVALARLGQEDNDDNVS